MSEQSQSIPSLITEFLDQPPSCLEFCPKEPNYFVVGTYLLQEHREKGDTAENEEENNTSSSTIKQTKTGTLQLWHLDVNTPKLHQKQVIPLSHAVFDLHFHPRQQTLFGTAGSNGTVSLYSVSRDLNVGDDLRIQHIWTRSVHEDSSSSSIPALFLAWFPQNWFPVATIPYTDGFVVTFSDGKTSIFATAGADAGDTAQGGGGGKHDISKNNNVLDLIETQFEPTEFTIEAWFVALACYRGGEGGESKESFIFTGDDFGSLTTRRFSVLEEEDDKDPETILDTCLISNANDRARHHTAGVTAILPLPIVNMIDNAPILLTGSYDEYIRVYHATTNTPAKGSILAECWLGGGVWRLQVIHTENIRESADKDTILEVQFLVLASCMHAGTRIVKVVWKREKLGNTEVGDWDIQVLAQFTEHESMNYASGVWKGGDSSDTTNELVCVSSSFYDKRLCLWKVQL